MFLRKKILFAAILSLATLGLGELFLRVIGFRYREVRTPVVFAELDLGEIATQPRYLRPDPLLFWSLVPGAELSFINDRVFEVVNSIALRGWEIEPKKAEGTRRILLLGDSCTFGVGVPYLFTYGSRIEHFLNARSDGHRYEVLNLGVPAYSSYQLLRVLKERGIEFEPDVVIVYAGQWNDLAPAVDRSDREKGEILERGGGGPSVRDRSYGGLRVPQLVSRILSPLRDRIQMKRVWRCRESFERGELLCGERVPIDEFRQNLRSIADLCRSSGIPLFFLPGPVPAASESRFPSIRTYKDAVRDVARERSVGLIDLDAEFASFDVDDVFRDFIHPSEKGHRRIAEGIFRVLCEHHVFELPPDAPLPRNPVGGEPIMAISERIPATARMLRTDKSSGDRWKVPGFALDVPGEVVVSGVEIPARSFFRGVVEWEAGPDDPPVVYRLDLVVDSRRIPLVDRRIEAPAWSLAERAILDSFAGRTVDFVFSARATSGDESRSSPVVWQGPTLFRME